MLHLTPMMGKSDTSYWEYQENQKDKKKNRLSLQNLYKSYIKTETKKLFWSLWVASLCICTFHPDMGVEGF